VGDSQAAEEGEMSASVNFADAMIEAIVEGVVKRLNGSQAPSARPRLLTVEAAGEYLSRTPSAIRHLINQGRIPSVKLDARVFIDVRDLDRVIEESKETAIS
jgi:Helix-turn-helix domain